MENVLELAQQEEAGNTSRRAALLMGGAALAGLAFSKAAKAQSTPAPAVNDTDILNFALNLEFLEAQFYAYATTGKAYAGTTSGVGTTGTVTIKSNPMVPFASGSPLQPFAMELAQEEANHVAFLQSALNATSPTSVAMPDIDLMTSFQTLAAAAGIANASSFDPFASEANFLIGAFVFEDVGVTAYLGAAALIQNSAYLDKAAGILAVEAYHAGSIRQRIFEAGTSAQQLSQMIAATRAKLDGSTATNNLGADDIGVMVATNQYGQYSTILDGTYGNAMTNPRTTTQVLNIVYGGQSGGGVFFPKGMNGTIK